MHKHPSLSSIRLSRAVWAQNSMTPKFWLLDCERARCRELAPWVPKDKHLEQECGAVSVAKSDSFLLLYQQSWATVKGLGVTLLS